MKTESEYPFTASQFDALAKDEREAVLAVAKYLTDSTVEVCDEHLSEALNLMKESEGCVPSEETGDDLLATVRRKFAAVYQVAAELAAGELKKRKIEGLKGFNFCLVIEASYEDATHVVIVDYDKPICYLHEWSKSWHVGFENLAALARAVLSTKAALVEKIQELSSVCGSEV